MLETLKRENFSYAQALKTVGKDIKDYQKATTGTQHKFLDIRFENERLVVLVECKNKFSRWDKAKIQGQLQDYVRFEKAYSDKKIVAILAETDGDEVWVWFVNLSLSMTNIAWKKKPFFVHLKNTKTCVLVG